MVQSKSRRGVTWVVSLTLLSLGATSFTSAAISSMKPVDFPSVMQRARRTSRSSDALNPLVWRLSDSRGSGAAAGAGDGDLNLVRNYPPSAILGYSLLNKTRHCHVVVDD